MVANKFRYLVMELHMWGQQQELNQLTQAIVLSAIRKSISINFGQHGSASCGNYLQVKYVNSITNLLIVRCTRKEYRNIWCAITFITEINDRQVVFNLLDLSGSIRACKRIASEYDMKKLNILKQRNWLSSEQVQHAKSYFEKIQQLEG